ncbi:hypothetical protein [Hyphomicrobium sp.]|uniref:hypothetical protein n=1 Tax=Hyphomicrobium sp. TaxID=82 RepID=UPI000F9E3491|nr:hypothetical protein [Hyphomicrobium sp.]RUP00437.1 MAG: hypothetical protein EKK30_01505 [Hyphomicrobium sp.]
MSEVSEIKPAEIYSDLTSDDIAEMMAEAARVDSLFQTGRISTTYLSSLAAAADAIANWEEVLPANAA